MKHNETSSSHANGRPRHDGDGKPPPGQPAKTHASELFVQQCEEGNQLAAAVIDIARPLLNRTKNPFEMEMIMTLAVQVWNMMLLPESRRFQFLRELIEAFSTDPDGADVREALARDLLLMGDRRERRHGIDRRTILEYNLVRKGETLVFNVIGTAAEEAA